MNDGTEAGKLYEVLQKRITRQSRIELPHRASRIEDAPLIGATHGVHVVLVDDRDREAGDLRQLALLPAAVTGVDPHLESGHRDALPIFMRTPATNTGAICMNTLVDEGLIPLADASEKIPTNPTPGRLRQWAHRGVAGHRLETLRVGREIFTSSAAVDRFMRAINSR
jgi:hypothetical protein